MDKPLTERSRAALTEAQGQALDRNHLTSAQAESAMTTILSGDATSAQLVAFVVAMRAKGESSEELAGLLDAVLAHASIVPLTDELRDTAVDIVGTGGDHSHSINVSTMRVPRRSTSASLRSRSSAPGRPTARSFCGTTRSKGSHSRTTWFAASQ